MSARMAPCRSGTLVGIAVDGDRDAHGGLMSLSKLADLVHAARRAEVPVPDGRAPLAAARPQGVMAGDARALTALIAAGADVREPWQGCPPLVSAARDCLPRTLAMIPALLAAGADPTAPSPSGRTALMHLCMGERTGSLNTMVQLKPGHAGSAAAFAGGSRPPGPAQTIAAGGLQRGGSWLVVGQSGSGKSYMMGRQGAGKSFAQPQTRWGASRDHVDRAIDHADGDDMLLRVAPILAAASWPDRLLDADLTPSLFGGGRLVAAGAVDLAASTGDPWLAVIAWAWSVESRIHADPPTITPAIAHRATMAVARRPEAPWAMALLAACSA